MASLLRVNLPRLYSRIASRQIQTSALRRYDPAPIIRPEHGTSLEALQAKEKGPWTDLTKEEKVALYRVQFNKTIPESKQVEPYVVRLIAYLAMLGALGVGMFGFMRKYIGPVKPRTLTDQWREDSIKKSKLQRANPITGISSKP